MHLGIYSLEKVLFRGEVSSVNLPTESGEITILENHRPIITLVKKGVIKVVDQSAQEHYVEVKHGFLEMRPGNQIKILVEQ